MFYQFRNRFIAFLHPNTYTKNAFIIQSSPIVLTIQEFSNTKVSANAKLHISQQQQQQQHLATSKLVNYIYEVLRNKQTLEVLMN